MEAKKEWFESWFDSPYHKLLYKNRDDNEAKSFVNYLLEYLKIPAGSSILDIACGDGRHAQYLQTNGNKVVGIDLSERRIKEAKLLENDLLHFYEHDMRNVFRANYFDYAFNFFTSFGYFQNYRDNVIAANAFSKALRPNGTLVLDYMNINFVEQHLINEDIVVQGNIEFHIKRKIENGKVIKQIDFRDENGKPKHFEEVVSGFVLADFKKIFSSSGLELQSLFGDYELNAFEPKASPRLIMLFKKANSV